MSFQGEQHPGVAPVAPQTQGFRLNHTMLRVKDPERALAFYSKVFGMQVLRRLDFEEMQFSLYFLANVEASDSVPEDTQARTAWTFSQKGLLELTHNWG
ncbi:MAG: VOC family protein, partial [Pseudomonadota bacterium]|nr:VOC family protein [Pseudomonadota bacterium]